MRTPRKRVVRLIKKMGIARPRLDYPRLQVARFARICRVSRVMQRHPDSPRYFPKLEVERGGTGAGTIIRFEVRLRGSTRRVRAEVSEPRPGEALVETDLATGARTTFLVTPRPGGRESDVTITTEWESRGLRGWLEGMTAPQLLRRIYAAELALLASLFAGSTA